MLWSDSFDFALVKRGSIQSTLCKNTFLCSAKANRRFQKTELYKLNGYIPKICSFENKIANPSLDTVSLLSCGRGTHNERILFLLESPLCRCQNEFKATHFQTNSIWGTFFYLIWGNLWFFSTDNCPHLQYQFSSLLWPPVEGA